MVKVAQCSRINNLLANRIVKKAVAPDAAAAVAWRPSPPPNPHAHRPDWVCRAGAASLASHLPHGTDTVFDLASLTKPVTALLVARLARRGVFALPDALDLWVPKAQGTAVGRVSLETLLAHRSGIEAHRELFAPLRSGQPISKSSFLRQAASCSEPGTPKQVPQTGPKNEPATVYSDLGYILVGAALEVAGQRDLDDLVQAEVSTPLGIELGSARQWAKRDSLFLDRVAATENIEWRGGLLRGVVHDDNAWALGGTGTCGHAGLFGTVTDVVKLGMAILDCLDGKLPHWLSRAEILPLTKPRPGSTMRTGFDGKSGKNSSVGTRLGPETIGHLGFTGTSFWCDPDAQVVVSLLTNRVNPTRDNPRLTSLRPCLHDALAAMALENRR